MHIKIITTEAFPVGLAASNRIMSYAKGFIENGCNVSVLCMIPTEDREKIFNPYTEGTFDGIRYKYTCGNPVRSKYFIIRRFSNFLGILAACIDLLKENKSGNGDAVIYYSSSTSRALILYLISRIKRIMFLKEESELPVGYFNDMSLVQKFCFLRFHHRLFDGLLLISNKLEKYFISERNLGIPAVIIPMTVDFDRFDRIVRNARSVRYIAYCGSLNNEKDGVHILLQAFALLSREFGDIMLYLVGTSATEKEDKQYQNIIAENHLEDKVKITGRIGRDEVPALLCGATMLALARPESLQAEGGFPTKLGEYLATGNPVIVTRVGEIQKYFNDGIDLFLAEPGSVQSFSENMKRVLLDYNSALKIGVHGRESAKRYFNQGVQTKKILDFINTLSKKTI